VVSEFSVHVGRRGEGVCAPRTRVAQAVAAFAGLALIAALGTPARASDVVTINNTDGYVDPAIAAEFITVPNICEQGLATPDVDANECDKLGVAAVLAATGTGPDVYFEPAGSMLQATNAFVPSNPGSSVNDTGYAPIFTFHKYDLFGRAEDRMGPLNREEILFMEQIPTTGGGITTGQTVPGEDTYAAMLAVLLMNTQGATTYNAGGHTFNYSEMAFFQHATGFSSGQRTTVINWCNANIGAFICGLLTDEQIGVIYVQVNFPNVGVQQCYAADNSLFNSTNCKARDGWMDQTVVGYVESWQSLGGDLHFSQNFRSQVGYDPAATILDSGTQIHTDQRIQQSAELSGAFTTEASDPGDAINPANMDFIAGRQTFTQTIATESTQDFGWLLNWSTFPHQGKSLEQLVSQDVNGYFFSCLNCDNAALDAAGYQHAFTPNKLDLTYMPYVAGWQTVPTVIHAP
jgi:hypothetical protein